MAFRIVGFCGRNITPTPYLPSRGKTKSNGEVTFLINSLGIWIRSPAPSPVNGSAPTAPRCLRFLIIFKPMSIILRDFLFLISATKPTPHESFSNEGSYIPCAFGGKLNLLFSDLSITVLLTVIKSPNVNRILTFLYDKRRFCLLLSH